MDSTFLNEFRSPGSAYRGKPFWAWNGRLAPEELRRQIRVMHRMGLGGFFMHSRVGLDTAYLSDEWFECVDACIDEAKKLDMEAWLYDEDRWPSGAAGGLVTKNPEYRRRSLHMIETRDPKKLEWSKDVLAAFTARVRNRAATDVKRLKRGKRPRKPARGVSILIFRVVLDPLTDWHNGYTYLDTMNHKAVKKFIQVTHEAYRKKCGKHFGKVVPGIFTDEPNHGGKLPGGGQTKLPWTGALPKVFRKRYGYDIVKHIPELFYNIDGDGVTPTRYHYHDCVTHLFVDAFARQIGEWCEKNGIQHTGHVLAEETLESQTGVVGSAMRFYEHMQAPGMDILTERNREYDTAKQVSSAARQFGRKWRLTETYGCTGWDFAFDGHKAIGDWQVALGINLRCQHLSWYTMEGQAKRDYPAGIFYQSPWWELYPTVEDYYARTHAAMTRGEEVRDLLVVHPVESMWTRCRVGWKWSDEVRGLEDAKLSLRDGLCAENIDFDYGDEEIMSRHAKVTRAGGVPVVKLGRAAYRAVALPAMVTMRRSTLELLAEFRKRGGVVVFAGEPATYVDAVASGEPAALAAGCLRVKSPRAAARAVEGACRRVSIATPDGEQIHSTLYMLREDKDAFYLFVCNTGHELHRMKNRGRSEPMVRDRKETYPDVRILGPEGAAGDPVELDAETGKAYLARAKRVKGRAEVRTDLPPLSSRIFVFPKKKVRKKLPVRKLLRNVKRSKLGGKRWDVTLSECNNLVLDRPRYRIGDGAWQGPEEILRVDRQVRAALGIKARGGQMVQPWAREKLEDPKRVRVQLSYNFDVEACPTGDLFLALEQPKTFRIFVNGVELSTDADAGWWTDLSLRRIPLDPALLKPGANTVLLSCDYAEDHPGLEIVYLLGNFGARVDGTDVAVTGAVDSLRLGDWVKQGLAFYSGSVCYVKKIRPKLRKGRRLFVEVPDYRGVAVRVIVDGRPAGVTGWEPNEVDITDFVNGDAAELRIEVIGHRRNSHGPHHLSEKWPAWTGPNSFVSGGKGWIDGYQLVPVGLMKAPSLVVRK